ncbi:TPA: type II toxin-antitoxin system HicB family antitoxin [Candidatus Micrarchaeota archaeon]|nr:type II toxin-antitoxin system HicB family antitoxin [Candidatus Micrarchaeota archaeon]
MTSQYALSAVITKGKIAYAASCPELGVTSQGSSEEKALDNLKEAVELYLEDEDVQEMLKKNPIKPAHITPFAVTA